MSYHFINVLHLMSHHYCSVTTSTWVPSCEKGVDFETVKSFLEKHDFTFMFDFRGTLVCNTEESAQALADSFGFVKQPLTVYQRMTVDWSDEFYQEMNARDHMVCPYGHIFDETVQILEQLGCSIYVGNSMPLSLRKHIKQGTNALYLRFKTGENAFYFKDDNAMNSCLWHEAWHYLQSNPPKGMDRSSFIINDVGECSLLSKNMLKEGMHRLFSRGSYYTEETYKDELPAFAVQNEHYFVLKFLRTLVN